MQAVAYKVCICYRMRMRLGGGDVAVLPVDAHFQHIECDDPQENRGGGQETEACFFRYFGEYVDKRIAKERAG